MIGLDSLVIPCDAQRVERILANLISNALEHGMGRPVIVEVMLEGSTRRSWPSPTRASA